MDIQVLGPLEASVDGLPIPLGGAKPRALLAILALNAGSTVSSERLIDGLWGEHPPATATKLVQVYVSQLRKALAESGDNGAIVTRGRGYALRVEPDAVDAGRFERLIARGAPREALALWRGPPLDDVANEPFAAAEIRRLEELRLAALELAIESDLHAGRHRDVIGELDSLVAAEPLREQLHAQRMLALYRCGRQADALEAYRQARAALVDAIGSEPGPELRRLHEAILSQDPALEPPPAEAAELPAELDAATPMAGRGPDLEWLRELWRRAHAGNGSLALIAGAHGMGKTRLAAELAGEVFRDHGAVLYASGRGPPDTVLAALASVHSARRPTLLVLDDLDRAGNAVRTALDELGPALAVLPVLVLATTGDADGTAELRADEALSLAPLDADAVLAVARLYSGTRSDAEIPVERLAEESRGIPQHLHRAAGEWARTEAARRLGASADRAAAERTGLRAAEDELAGDVVELQALRERAEPRGGRPEVVACPFKGLASFDIDDAEFFFGRERLVAEMVARLAGAPLMAVVGRSGSGKSSALRAGLLPALAAGVLPGSEGWALALLRPGEHPLRALEQATADAAPRGRLVIAVDQFEEVFTACGDERERVAFIDALVAGARDSRRRALVLLAIRADFYGRCDAYPELARLMGANHVLVGPMRRDELRRAIELPAQRAGLRVEPNLVDALIAGVEDEPGALPLLSTSLLELWQQRDGRRLRLSAYEQAGGVQGAVARLAERAYARLEPGQRDIARQVLMRLAGEGEGDAVVRQRVPLAELEGDGVAEVLSVLADDRLVSIGEGEVEVAHEALLREWPRLRSWLEEDAQGRRLHHHLSASAREWDAGGRDPGELYRGARLSAALDWSGAHEHELNAAERAFLHAGRTANERSQRRLRATLASVAALLVLAVIAGLVALGQRGTAREEATAAEAQRLGARALVEKGFDHSVLLARQAVALDDTVQTRGNLFAALLKSPAAIGVLRGEGEKMTTVELSPDGHTLAAGDPIGNVFLFDTRTRQRVATIRPGNANSWILALAYSPDGSRLAIGHDTAQGNIVTVFDSESRRAVATLRTPSDRFIDALRFSPDGSTLDVMAGAQFQEMDPALLARFDARTGRRVERPLRINRPQSPLLATSDGARLVTGGKGEVVLRDAATLGESRRFDVGDNGSVHSGAYALGPDDRTVAIGDKAGSLRFLDLDSGAVRVGSNRHSGAVTAVTFTPDGRTLISAGEDGHVIAWDVTQGTPRETLTGHANGISSMQVTPDGQTLYTASLDGTVFIWDLGGSRRLGRPFTAGADGGPWTSMSSDGRLIAMGQNDGAVSIVDGRTLKPRATFPAVPKGAVAVVGFVPGSHVLVVGAGDDGYVALFDADSGRPIRRLAGHRSRINVPGMSADGRLLTTSSSDGTVRFWSLPDGAGRGGLRFTREIFNSQLSPDGRWLSVVLIDEAFKNHVVEVWDVRKRRRLHSLRHAQWGITRFSPDSRLMAFGDRVGRTRVWSTQTWKPVTRSLTGDPSGIATAVISRNGRTLATANDTGAVRLWDIRTQQSIGAPLPGEPSRSAATQFTPDGTGLIASYDNGRAYLWDMRPERLLRQSCQVAGRRLTRDEWAEFLPGRDYDPAC